jgi:hypothetical protein
MAKLNIPDIENGWIVDGQLWHGPRDFISQRP